MNFENLISNALNSGNLYSKDNFIRSYNEFRKIGLKLIFMHYDYENNELFKKLDSLNKVLVKIKIDEIKKIYSYHQKYNKNIIENNDISIMYYFNNWFNDLKKMNIEKYFYTNNERIKKIKPYYKKNIIKIIKK
jgi:hypothetical protein